jgi:hypothetical protein
MKSTFSNADIPSDVYVQTVRASWAPTPIQPRYARAGRNTAASQIVAQKTNIGVSSNAYDLKSQDASKLDLGLLYSNGARYRYIAFRAENDPNCSAIIPDQVVKVVEQTDDGPIIVDQEVSEGVLVKAYVGNAIVVPFLPNPDIVTDTTPPPARLPVINIPCRNGK